MTRDKVIEAALELLDREGVEATTMRRLSEAVGVTPMALYNHFSSKTTLLRAIAEQVLDQAEFDGHYDDWREQVRHCFRVFRGICLHHPCVPRLLQREQVAPPSVFAPMEVTLRALMLIGMRDQDALRAYFTLVGFTLSQAAYQVGVPLRDLEPSKKVRSERLSGRGYREIEALEAPDHWDYDQAFEFGLSLIIFGIEHVTLAKEGNATPDGEYASARDAAAF